MMTHPLPMAGNLPLVAKQLPSTNHNIGMSLFLTSIVSFYYTDHTQQVTRKKKMKILDICLLILSVSLLCVLVTTAPAGQSDDGSSPTMDKAVVTKNDTTLKNSTTTAKNETSVATPTNATTTNTTTVSNDTQETTPISQAEKEKYTIEPSSSTKRDDKPKPKSAKFLLYEVEKDIRNLSLDNVNYIIDMGPDVLAYSLLDKLGYREGDIEDDPHLKVIEDNKDKLFAKLKVRRKELTPVTKPPLPSTEPPPRVTTTHVVDVTKIKYDIMKRIKALSLAEFDNLLDVYDIDTLPYALGIQLGYDDESNAEYFKYLGDQGGKELREILLAEKEKKSNMAPPPTPTAKPEPPKDSSSNEPNGGKNHPDDNKEGGDPDGENLADKYDGQDNLRAGDDDPKLDQQEGPSSNSDDQRDGTTPAGDHNGSNQGPPDDENGDDVNTNDKEPDNKGQTRTGKDPLRGNPDGDDPLRGNPDGDDPLRGNPDGDDPLRGNPDGDDPLRGNPDGDDPLRGNPDGAGDDALPGEDGDNGNMWTDDDDDIMLAKGGEKQDETKPQPKGNSDNTLEEEGTYILLYNRIFVCGDATVHCTCTDIQMYMYIGRSIDRPYIVNAEEGGQVVVMCLYMFMYIHLAQWLIGFCVGNPCYYVYYRLIKGAPPILGGYSFLPSGSVGFLKWSIISELTFEIRYTCIYPQLFVGATLT